MLAAYRRRGMQYTYREKYVAPCCYNQRDKKCPINSRDTPTFWDEVGGEYSHSNKGRKAENKRNPEALEDLGHFKPEVRALDFFLGSAPGNIIREHMRQEGLREVDAEAAKEEKAVKRDLESRHKEMIFRHTRMESK